LITLQQESSENLLLICCRSPEQRETTGADLSREMMVLDQTNPSDSTKAREIAANFLQIQRRDNQ
jgi:hypothetical protein